MLSVTKDSVVLQVFSVIFSITFPVTGETDRPLFSRVLLLGFLENHLPVRWDLSVFPKLIDQKSLRGALQ